LKTEVVRSGEYSEAALLHRPCRECGGLAGVRLGLASAAPDGVLSGGTPNSDFHSASIGGAGAGSRSQ